MVVEGGTAPEPGGPEAEGGRLTGGAGPAPSGSERQVSGRSGGAAAGAHTRSQGRAIPVESFEAGERRFGWSGPRFGRWL